MPLSASVQHEDGGVLVLLFPDARPDNWMGERFSVATPARVADAIRAAQAAGWEPLGKKRTFFGLATGTLGSSEQSVLSPRTEDT